MPVPQSAAQALNDEMRRADAQSGMAWWNSLTKTQRAEWLARAGSAKPADAWALFKLERRSTHPRS